MGVIAVQFQSWFFSSIDTIKPRPAPPQAPASVSCPAVPIGWGSRRVSVFSALDWSARRAGDGFDCVILVKRLHEHAQCPKNTHKHKDPQEEAVDHHGNVLPVLAHL